MVDKGYIFHQIITTAECVFVNISVGVGVGVGVGSK